MYTKFINTLVAAFYANGVQGRPQAISKLTWKEYEEALTSGHDPASNHLKTAVEYGYQVSELIFYLSIYLTFSFASSRLLLSLA